MNKSTFFLSIILFAIIVSLNTIAFSETSVAKTLGWQIDDSHHYKDGLCGGYYAEPAIIANVPHPPNYEKVPVIMTAKGPTIFRTDGVSVLQDNVKIQQPGRLIHADKAVIYHDKRSGKITDIQLIGHVRVQEAGKLLVGTKANYNIAKNTFTINKAVYHIAGEHKVITVSTPFDAWGTAKSIHRDANDIIHLKEATYSTCAPENPSWVIFAKKMILNHNTQEGYAQNVVIRFKKIPIFYTPYYSFPLNAARKSGFLMPVTGYITGQGFYISEPYYWNMASNYDWVLSPGWYSERGMQLNSNFRYLTHDSHGFFYTSFLPNDRSFAQFKQDTANGFASNTSSTLTPYLSELQDSSYRRAYIDFENHVTFNDNWTGLFYARYVTDPYFAEDFQSEYLQHNTNQIPSFAEVDYQRNHWQSTFLLQAYQTLHPLDQSPTPAFNQYQRLPEIDFNAAYPQFLSDLNFNLSGQAVRFAYQSAFAPLTYQVPIGERIHLQPSLSLPFTWSSFYVTPQVTADSTNYFSQLAAAGPTSVRPTDHADRTLPIFNIDSGLYFDHSMTFFQKQYIQTIEPRVFYLYTPYLNQDNYPNFDTQLLPFSISDLYALNQFSGFDRLQNANQLSIGLTSNVLRETDSAEILNAQLGVIDYLTTPRVCLVQGCQPTSGSTSPLAGALTWYPNSFWSVSSQAAWDTVLHQMNNAQIGVQYHFSLHHIIVLKYQFAHGNPDQPFDQFGFSTNSSLITAGLVWPLTQRWHFFGYTYYDLTHHHPQNQYVGLSYDTCCWAVRFIAADAYNGTSQINGNPTFQNQYTSTYYVEFLLKGLGSAGNHHAEDILTTTLPGYEDVFSNKGHYGYSQSV